MACGTTAVVCGYRARESPESRSEKVRRQFRPGYHLAAMNTQLDDILVGVAGVLIFAFWAAVAWQLLA